MNVQQLIQKLQQFPQDAEVKICDGFQGYFYEGDFEIQMFEDYVDIGIGGFEVGYQLLNEFLQNS